jgi:hypothetical protein
VLVDDAQQFAANTKFLVGRKHQYLGYGDACFGRLVELFEGGTVSDKLAVHVDQEVVPIRIHVDEGSALDVELKQGLQVVIRLPKQRIIRVHLVHPQHLRLSAV